MGGFGVWSILSQHPDLFVAAIPICCGGDAATAHRGQAVPGWTFHGTAADIVPVSETREMVKALQKAGGQPIYWEYAGATHTQTAERAYCEPQLIEWLFAQAKP